MCERERFDLGSGEGDAGGGELVVGAVGDEADAGGQFDRQGGELGGVLGDGDGEAQRGMTPPQPRDAGIGQLWPTCTATATASCGAAATAAAGGPPPIDGQPVTANVAGTFTVLSAFWSVRTAVAVPEGGLQVAWNRPFGPELSDTSRPVSGMSGSPVNEVVFVTRLTVPTSVSGNGDGNTSVSEGPLIDPVR